MNILMQGLRDSLLQFLKRLAGEMTLNEAKQKYQFINRFPDWQGFHFRKAVYGLALIYDWYLWIGFFEIRRWHNLKDGDIEAVNKEPGER